MIETRILMCGPGPLDFTCPSVTDVHVEPLESILEADVADGGESMAIVSCVR